MREALLDFLRCPVTRARLELVDAVRDPTGAHIMEGTLVSPEGRRYPVRGGIPCLHSGGYRSGDEEATVTAFGEEWARYDEFDGYMGSAELFTDFTGLEARDVAGKTVLEVGCGGGRWLSVMAGSGAKEVVGLDLGRSVVQALRRTAHLPNAHVVQASALALPFEPRFDLVVSIGVLHHVEDPVAALRQMRLVLSSGDHVVAVWVYGREGSGLYLRLVRPLRWVGPRLPPAVLAWLSRGLAVPVWAHARTLNRLAVRTRVPLPLRNYLDLLSRLQLKEVESVVYDQMAPRIARYVRREELLGWVAAAGAQPIRLHQRRGNSWQCRLRFPMAERPDAGADGLDALPGSCPRC